MHTFRHIYEHLTLGEKNSSYSFFSGTAQANSNPRFGIDSELIWNRTLFENSRTSSKFQGDGGGGGSGIRILAKIRQFI
jgi:hypothetical protein